MSPSLPVEEDLDLSVILIEPVLVLIASRFNTAHMNSSFIPLPELLSVAFIGEQGRELFMERLLEIPMDLQVLKRIGVERSFSVKHFWNYGGGFEALWAILTAHN